MRKQKTMGNKGFSLVELIVVIAIMVVLVAVLAPTFTKYVESSRRATDVQNANSIASAVIAAKTDDTLEADSGVAGDLSDAGIKDAVKTKGNAVEKNADFAWEYDADTNTCSVTVSGAVDDLDLTTEGGAKTYKDADKESLKK